MTAPEPDIPQVVVSRKRGPSVIWIVPIVAAVVVLWIWWGVAQEQGPPITIRFDNASGLEAGKTEVKLRDVVVGRVERITFEKDLSGVAVRASMSGAAEDFLLDSTRFWVVKPRIGAGSVQGLETLISGAYIAMEPGRSGGRQREFQGLEEPPVAPVDAPGLKLTLTHDRLSGLTAGSPVLFRDIEVGIVERTRLLSGDEGVEIDIYIRRPFRDRVHDNSRFWNAGGVQVSLGTEGVDVHMESLSALLTGGVAFDTFTTPGPPAEAGQRFPMFETRDEAEHVYLETLPVVMVFDESVRGLSPGAPVEFMGIEVGEVTSFELVYDTNRREFLVPVKAELHEHIARVVGASGGLTDDPAERLGLLVAGGLRARLNTGSLLTGSLYVQLELLPDDDARVSGLDLDAWEIPTVPSTASEITRTIQRLPDLAADLKHTVSAVKELVTGTELAAVVDDVQSIVEQLEGLSGEAARGLPPLLDRVDRIASHAEETITAFRESERDLSGGASRALDELSATLRSVRLLAELLERHPEALLQGKERDP